MAYDMNYLMDQVSNLRNSGRNAEAWAMFSGLSGKGGMTGAGGVAGGLDAALRGKWGDQNFLDWVKQSDTDYGNTLFDPRTGQWAGMGKAAGQGGTIAGWDASQYDPNKVQLSTYQTKVNPFGTATAAPSPLMGGPATPPPAPGGRGAPPPSPGGGVPRAPMAKGLQVVDDPTIDAAGGGLPRPTVGGTPRVPVSGGMVKPPPSPAISNSRLEYTGGDPTIDGSPRAPMGAGDPLNRSARPGLPTPPPAPLFPGNPTARGAPAGSGTPSGPPTPSNGSDGEFTQADPQLMALIEAMARPNAIGDPFDFYNDEGYQHRLKEGTDALENSAAARGQLFSGATLKDITKFAQGEASQEYDKAYQRYDARRKFLEDQYRYSNDDNYKRKLQQAMVNNDNYWKALGFNEDQRRDSRDFDWRKYVSDRDYTTGLDKWEKEFGYNAESKERDRNMTTLMELVRSGLLGTQGSGNLAADLARLFGNNTLTGAGAGAAGTRGGANDINNIINEIINYFSRKSMIPQ